MTDVPESIRHLDPDNDTVSLTKEKKAKPCELWLSHPSTPGKNHHLCGRPSKWKVVFWRPCGPESKPCRATSYYCETCWNTWGIPGKNKLRCRTHQQSFIVSECLISMERCDL